MEDEVAAALGNSGLAAWLALEWRAGLEPGETVLVLGATGAVGNVAVQAARLLGAGRVVAAARGGERLERLLERGADEVVDLDGEEDLAAALKEATKGGAQVIVDPLLGRAGAAAMKAAALDARHIQVGHMAAPTVELPAMSRALVAARAARLRALPRADQREARRLQEAHGAGGARGARGGPGAGAVVARSTVPGSASRRARTRSS